uniref:Protein SDA1 n=1 Tax=Meloidogyne javanica TaxID=6303 RepID=A0A915LQP3_MELJA
MEYSLLKIYSRLLFPNIKLFGIITSTRTFAAKPAIKGRGSTALPPDQEESYVEEDAEKLCKFVNVNYKNEDESPGPEIRPNSEYPSWIFKLDIEPNKTINWTSIEEPEMEKANSSEVHQKLKQSQPSSKDSDKFNDREVEKMFPDELKETQEKLQQFQQQLELIKIVPTDKNSSNLDDMIISLLKNSHKSLEKSPMFVELLINYLNGSHTSLISSNLRLQFTMTLVRLTMNKRIKLDVCMDILVKLLKYKDKALRKFIINSICLFIRSCCTRGKTGKKIKRLFSGKDSSLLKQKLFGLLLNAENEIILARVAQLVLIHAYHKQFWQDEKVANALAESVFLNKLQRIQISAMRFFLGSSKNEQGEEEESDSSDDSEIDNKNKPLKELMQQHKYTKKTRKRKKQLEEAKKKIQKEKRATKRGDKLTRSQCNLEAIRSIYDPQKFADKLFGLLVGHKRNEKYVVRLLQISLCARVIGIHKLQTLGFYSYLHRYLQPKQNQVTRLLLYAAQACHEFVPADIIEQLVRVIAQNFVTDRNSEEAITVGLNTIREIYANCPDAANEGMVRDLAEYKHIHNKNVSMAAHSKKRKQTKEERMEQVRLGREDRATTYAKPKKKGAHVGRTNRELAKRKNFKMVQHKMRGKNRQRSFRDRQLSLRNYLLRQQGKKV